MEEKKNDIESEKIHSVVDTSAFITYPDLISHVRAQAYIPLTVIKQLDGLKNNSNGGVSKRARQASFFIERAIAEKKVAILTAYDRIDALDSESDNRIVGAAVRLKNSNPDARVVLIATDRNMRIAAEGYGIVGMDLVVESGRTREDMIAEYWENIKDISLLMVALLGAGFFIHGLLSEETVLRYIELCLAVCIGAALWIAIARHSIRNPTKRYMSYEQIYCVTLLNQDNNSKNME